ncbi:MAG: ABC transporter ATP-binding protein [Leptotrichiaceae bacterium]|nr:ABC transporter ATP-binding protein [Leptotrichiaceae bacterium]
MIKFKNVDFSYENKKVLDNINFEIPKDKRKIAILGENGSGKSTLFLLMNGILKKKSGQIFIDGEELDYSKKKLIEIRKKVGIVFQDPETQIIAPTVFQEMGFGLENIGIKEENIHEKIDTYLKKFNLFDKKEDLCHTLSYGQKKRLSIASIVAMEPQILVLDEPLVWIDPKNYNEIKDLLNEVSREGTTVIFSTHDVNFAYEFADYIYIVKDGKIVREGNKKEVFNSMEEIKKYNLDFPEILKIADFLEKNYSFNKEEFIEKYEKEVKNEGNNN